jgi:hypothetical protein
VPLRLTERLRCRPQLVSLSLAPRPNLCAHPSQPRRREGWRPGAVPPSSCRLTSRRRAQHDAHYSSHRAPPHQNVEVSDPPPAVGPPSVFRPTHQHVLAAKALRTPIAAMNKRTSATAEPSHASLPAKARNMKGWIPPSPESEFGGLRSAFWQSASHDTGRSPARARAQT